MTRNQRTGRLLRLLTHFEAQERRYLDAAGREHAAGCCWYRNAAEWKAMQYRAARQRTLSLYCGLGPVIAEAGR